ncbi:hypothetical protein D9M69_684280 [compost metagenome]
MAREVDLRQHACPQAHPLAVQHRRVVVNDALPLQLLQTIPGRRGGESDTTGQVLHGEPAVGLQLRQDFHGVTIKDRFVLHSTILKEIPS